MSVPGPFWGTEIPSKAANFEQVFLGTITQPIGGHRKGCVTLRSEELRTPSPMPA